MSQEADLSALPEATPFAMDDAMRAMHAELRKEFPHDTVEVAPSRIRNNIHVLVVSRRFDGMSEISKSNMVWEIIREAQLPEREYDRVSLIMAYSPGELH